MACLREPRNAVPSPTTTTPLTGKGRGTGCVGPTKPVRRENTLKQCNSKHRSPSYHRRNSARLAEYNKNKAITLLQRVMAERQKNSLDHLRESLVSQYESKITTMREGFQKNLKKAKESNAFLQAIMPKVVNAKSKIERLQKIVEKSKVVCKKYRVVLLWAKEAGYGAKHTCHPNDRRSRYSCGCSFLKCKNVLYETDRKSSFMFKLRNPEEETEAQRFGKSHSPPTNHADCSTQKSPSKSVPECSVCGCTTNSPGYTRCRMCGCE